MEWSYTTPIIEPVSHAKLYHWSTALNLVEIFTVIDPIVYTAPWNCHTNCPAYNTYADAKTIRREQGSRL